MTRHLDGNRGATALTYGLVVGLVGIAALAAVTRIGDSIDSLFGATSSTLTSAIDKDEGQPGEDSGDALFEFTNHTFTTCGVASGSTPPTQSQCQSAYSSQPWASDTNLFSVTDGIQAWTVPKSGTYRFYVEGARGGRSRPGALSDSRGRGASVQGDLVLSKGDEIYLVVGQQGEGTDLGGSGSFYYPTGGFNGGGGTGYSSNSCGNCSHAQGGGASDVRVGGNGLNDRVIVAGGGGGSSTEQSSNSDLRYGGNAGGLNETAQDGQGSNQDSSSDARGRGGRQNAGGSGGYPSQSYRGTDGTFGVGGRGNVNDSGGGGGGWYGGGGGGDNGSGGGGSSYAAPVVTNTSSITGASSSNGSIRVTFIN